MDANMRENLWPRAQRFSTWAGGPRTMKAGYFPGAAMMQDFKPMQQICAHLMHSTNDPTGARCVEANHYCTHLTNNVRQCLIYDSPNKCPAHWR
ncbi:hypothetical protein N7533_003001 [Penicillium manginii]|uniref:uncharacterized protein n=1 Tax=Penicillium manginii TaxID=203109 RepID=UPI0025480A82|nr:uncharacterized protein N7533_003001 [Penicillium manginii]KAJ5764320.1 hypothetical protein N7533_003001 [Penicillium manginii]